MRTLVVKFEPSSKVGEFVVKVPAGTVPLCARRNNMGDGIVVLAAPDKPSKDLVPLRLLSLWETGAGGPAGGDLAGWRHLGCWSFDSGGWQHLFVAVDAPDTATPRASRRTRKADAVADSDPLADPQPD